MKKIASMAIFLAMFNLNFAEENIEQENLNTEIVRVQPKTQTLNTKSIYDSLNINDKIDYNLFQKAYLGYVQIANKNPGILIIIDYTKPSNIERFYVIDFSKNKLVYSTKVAHSKNSGLEIPLQFSDDPNSYQSSLGFFVTMGEYEGAYGHSLRLKGLEENINGNAEERAIVIHGGEIVEDSYIKRYGFAGRSLGCPVLPYSKSKEIINYIKNGRVLFINGNDEDYIENSVYLSHLSALFDGESKDVVNLEPIAIKKEETVLNSVDVVVKESSSEENIKIVKRSEKIKKDHEIFNALEEVDLKNIVENLSKAKLKNENEINLNVSNEEKNIQIENIKTENNNSVKKQKFSDEAIKKSLSIGSKYKKIKNKK